MSSMERAPEPTMEEILASIRRIISDDESNSARQRTASASQQQDEEGLEGAEADDRIINDIARVLSGGGTPPAGDEEDILDLTSELGGLEIVEEETSFEIAEEVVEVAPARASAEPGVFQLAEVETEPQAEAIAATAPEFQAEVQVPEPPAPPSMSASEEAASALERAIAALRAGQLPTSISEFSLQPEPAPQPEPQDFALEPAPKFEPELEPALKAELEPEPAMMESESEAIVEEPVVPEVPPLSEPDVLSWERETAPWAGAPEPLIEPERQSTRVNGGKTHDASNKSLEDSVKDMLRPMLQRWLEENMARVLTAALKDELRDNPARFQRD